VDDHAPFRRLLRSFFTADEVQITECSDGAEAVLHYAEHQPDWVLMDIEMKPMDGLKATARITARFPLAKVMVVTQHNDADLRSMAELIGARGCLWKEDMKGIARFAASVVAEISEKGGKV
jgi:two-component system nitrate/nitrite response regulator NarL